MVFLRLALFFLLGLAMGELLGRIAKSKRIIHVLENGMRVKRRAAMESFVVNGVRVNVVGRYTSYIGLKLWRSKKITTEEVLRMIEAKAGNNE